MRLRTALVAMLALVIQAQGAPVSPSEAASAVRGWAASGEHLGVDFRDRLDFSAGAVETTAVHTASSGAIFYTVKFKNGCGTVFLSGDTELEPVISFTASAKDYSVGGNAPLWALLDGDVSARRATDGASEKWNRYWAADPEKPRLRGARLTSPPSDLRVEPLIQSKWGQGNDGEGNPVFNYYTPNNYPCGYVATMTAQIMRYYHGPEDDGGWGLPLESVKPATFDCTVDGESEKLVLKGGEYAWDKMPLTLDEIAEDEQREAIGKLASDIGIAAKTKYAADLSDASIGYDLMTEGLEKVFGYKQTFYLEPGYDYSEYGGDMMCDAVIQNSIFANLDARRPCMLGIKGATGHAAVVDGYGFEGTVPYVHLNMGLEGMDDCWYNLPTVDAQDSGAEYSAVSAIGYNIFPEIGGYTKSAPSTQTHSIMSGRVLDADGNAVSDARVLICMAGKFDVFRETKTDEHGIWAEVLPVGSYDVEAKAGGLIGSANGVSVSPPNVNYFGGYEVTVGNSWGNDIELGDPLVMAGEEPFMRFDRAMEGAKAIAEETGNTVEVKVCGDGAEFAYDVNVDFDCVVFATRSSPDDFAVRRRNNAQLTVSDGASLVVSNIVFASEKGAGRIIDVVAEDCTLSIAGIVDFGVRYDVAAVRTCVAENFRLLDGISVGFTLQCASAVNEGDVFGYADAYTEAIDAGTVHIANGADESGEKRGHLQSGDDSSWELVWREKDVPYADCVGYFIDKDGHPVTAARIDRLIDSYTDALEHGDVGVFRDIVIRRDGTLSRPLSIADGLRFFGDGSERVYIEVAPTAGFTVTGGELSVSGMSFHGYKGNALFLVDGDDASLKLDGVDFYDIVGTNMWSGAVSLKNSGSAEISNALFDGCKADGVYLDERGITRTVSASGGAVYVGSRCSLSITDSTIVNCSARNSGGGVFVAADAKVFVAGTMTISGNEQGNDKKYPSDVYLTRNTSTGMHATMRLDGIVVGDRSVGVRWSSSAPDGGYGNDIGNLAVAAVTEEVAHESAKAVFNNASEDRHAVPDDDACALRWADSRGPQPWTGDPSDASARVEHADSTVTWYLLVSEALEAVTDEATIYVTGSKGLNFYDDIVISGKVTLVTDESFVDSFGYVAELARNCYLNERDLTLSGDCSIKIGSGASLTLRDISVLGEGWSPPNPNTDPDDPDDEGPLTAPTSKPLFDVCGGELVLDTPSDDRETSIYGVWSGPFEYTTDEGDHVIVSTGSRNAGAVSVWQGGRFVMRSGAEITSCSNEYYNPADGSSRGGAVLVDDGEVVLEGGTIQWCSAHTGGGVFIGSRGSIDVSGDVTIINNDNGNLVVHDGERMTLSGNMTGNIGYTEGVFGDRDVFGLIADDVSDEDALASAHKFTHDVTGDIGMVVAKGDTRLLVWSAALDDEGKYKDDDGTEYDLIAGDKVEIPVPSAVADLAYLTDDDGTPLAQIGVVERIGFTASGNVAVNAGKYTATVSLRPGYVWTGGSTDAKDVTWYIGKATYDIDDVSFDDASFTYNAKWRELEISGTLPSGVTVRYENNRRRAVGSQEATAYLIADDPLNFETIDGVNVAIMEATLTINPIPISNPEYEYAQPVDIDFSALVSDDGTEWIISVTDAVERCWYSLYETDSLSDGFLIDGVKPKERRQATPDDVPTIIFTRPRTGEQLFWRVKAESEDVYY